jgi:hypothetical protein
MVSVERLRGFNVFGELCGFTMFILSAIALLLCLCVVWARHEAC